MISAPRGLPAASTRTLTRPAAKLVGPDTVMPLSVILSCSTAFCSPGERSGAAAAPTALPAISPVAVVTASPTATTARVARAIGLPLDDEVRDSSGRGPIQSGRGVRRHTSHELDR